MLFKRDGLPKIYRYYSANYPKATFGLISYTRDKVIRYYLNQGQPKQPAITGEAYFRGLLNIRSKLPKNWGTYYVAGTSHTMITGNKFYHAAAGGDSLYKWVGKLLRGISENAEP
jgi:hypothetical protein